jgi:hypothetical protein
MLFNLNFEVNNLLKIRELQFKALGSMTKKKVKQKISMSLSASMLSHRNEFRTFITTQRMLRRCSKSGSDAIRSSQFTKETSVIFAGLISAPNWWDMIFIISSQFQIRS